MRSWLCVLVGVLACSHPPKQTHSVDMDAATDTGSNTSPVLTVGMPTTFDEVVPGPEYVSQGSGAIASTGSTYFMAWVTHGGPNVLLAAHFFADGTRVEPKPIIIEAGGSHPRVACTAAGTCGLLWDSVTTQQKFVRIAADGTIIDTTPQVFFAANTGLVGATSDLLIVELAVGLGTDAMRFGATGPTLDATPVTWSGAPSVLGCDVSACWSTDDTGLRRFGDDGTTETFAIPAALTSANGSGITTISCGASSCLATATDDSQNHRLIGFRFGLDGVFLDPIAVELLATTNFGTPFPKAAADGDGFLVAALSNLMLYTVRLSAAGVTSQLVSAMPSQVASGVSCVSTGCFVIASKSTGIYPAAHIYGVQTMNGVPAPTLTLLTTAANSQHLPVLAYGADYLVTWTDERVAGIVGRGARWSGGGDPIVDSEVAPPIVEQLAWRGDGYLGLMSSGSMSIVLDASGAPVGAPIALGSTPVKYEVACTSIGTCMMVFYTGTSVGALPIGSDGHALSAAVTLAATPPTYFAPGIAVAWLGDRYVALVAQDDGIEEHVLTPDGIETDMIQLPVGAQEARIALSSNGAFIVWEKYSTDIEGISGALLGGLSLDLQLQPTSPAANYATFDNESVPTLIEAIPFGDGFAYGWRNPAANAYVTVVDSAAALLTTQVVVQATSASSNKSVQFQGGPPNSAEFVASEFSPDLDAYRLQMIRVSWQ